MDRIKDDRKTESMKNDRKLKKISTETLFRALFFVYVVAVAETLGFGSQKITRDT